VLLFSFVEHKVLITSRQELFAEYKGDYGELFYPYESNNSEKDEREEVIAFFQELVCNLLIYA